ncbi:MAG: tetratricopeptide repeat protein [Balneolaceae bacterium]|nr:tetratricopeptide repeat protein [Balneolaceae bacterium]
MLFFGCCLLFFPLQQTAAQNAFEEGKRWYEQRAAQADSFRADPNNIQKAIRAFEKALSRQTHTRQAAIWLLRSYYFKGMFTGLDEKQQQATFDRGKELGERMMQQFPKSVPIKFWYSANAGRWADVHGFWPAATDGISKKLRNVSREIIRLDSTYEGGGGYRILAQVHFYSPNIPFVMGWPSDEKALQLVQKAVSIAPEHPSNLLLHAQLLLEFDRTDEAREQLNAIVRQQPRANHLVEDRYVQYRARRLLQQNL